MTLNQQDLIIRQLNNLKIRLLNARATIKNDAVHSQLTHDLNEIELCLEILNFEPTTKSYLYTP